MVEKVGYQIPTMISEVEHSIGNQKLIHGHHNRQLLGRENQLTFLLESDLIAESASPPGYLLT